MHSYLPAFDLLCTTLADSVPPRPPRWTHCRTTGPPLSTPSPLYTRNVARFLRDLDRPHPINDHPCSKTTQDLHRPTGSACCKTQPHQAHKTTIDRLRRRPRHEARPDRRGARRQNGMWKRSTADRDVLQSHAVDGARNWNTRSSLTFRSYNRDSSRNHCLKRPTGSHPSRVRRTAAPKPDALQKCGRISHGRTL